MTMAGAMGQQLAAIETTLPGAEETKDGIELHRLNEKPPKAAKAIDVDVCRAI